MTDCPLVDAQNPTLQKRSDSTHSGHQLRCRFLPAFQNRDPMNVALAHGGTIAGPPVSVEGAARFDGFRQKGHKALAGCVWNPFHADPPDASSVLLCSNGNQGFPVHFRSVCQPRTPSSRPPRLFHLPLPFHSAGRGPAAPSLDRTCAAKPKQSCSCPTPAPFADPGRSHRSFGSPPSTWRGTSPPKVSECPGKSCRPSPMFGDRTIGTAGVSTLRGIRPPVRLRLSSKAPLSLPPGASGTPLPPRLSPAARRPGSRPTG